MRGQLSARDLFLNVIPSLIGQSKTDRVRVISNAFSHAVYSSGCSRFRVCKCKRIFAFANAKPRSPASTQVDAANFKFAACARRGVTCQIKSGAKHLRSLSWSRDVIEIDRFHRLIWTSLCPPLCEPSVRFSRRYDHDP